MHNSAVPRHRLPAVPRGSTRGLLAVMGFGLRLHERWRQRLHLSELDEHLLADIGLRREDVRRECAKPFWR